MTQSVLDPKNNRIPAALSTIHLIAVCGTAMGALACILKDLGYAVTGSDQAVYPPMSTYLKKKGIHISEGFKGGHLSHRPDLVVVGNAVTKHNPEVIRSGELGLAYCSMPQALNHFTAQGKKALVVTGTHGKTTTSAMLAWMLEVAGYDPTFIIGGILNNFGSNYRIGKGDVIVLEGDEYDTAFFDKGPKFFHYTPHTAILTSIEFDHADIFSDLDHVKRSFRQFITSMPRNSRLIAWDGEKNIEAVVDAPSCFVERYGKAASSDWRFDLVAVTPPMTVFDVFSKNVISARFKSPLMGEHNLLNTLSAIAAAHHFGLPVSAIQKAVETFQGVKRRQEIRGIKKGITVMDDFAHHPTAVRETIRAVRSSVANGRLWAVFEPRTNTSMRNIFQETYPLCFDEADLICIRKPPLLEKVPEDQRFSSETLVRDLVDRGQNAHYFTDTEAIIDFISRNATTGDLVLIMSNGGFDNIHKRLLDIL